MAVHVTVHTVCACARALCKLLLLIHYVPAQWKNAEDTARRISRTKRHNPGPLLVMCDPCCLAYFVEALRSFQNSHTWGFLFILLVQQRGVVLCCWSLTKKSGTSSRDLQRDLACQSQMALERKWQYVAPAPPLSNLLLTHDN